jgi:hypothetical protein
MWRARLRARMSVLHRKSGVRCREVWLSRRCQKHCSLGRERKTIPEFLNYGPFECGPTVPKQPIRGEKYVDS